jgi:ABC-type branched-subunit amino acid transport system ATPase component
MSLLRITDLRVDFGGLVALDAIELDVAAGHVHGIIGPNGPARARCSTSSPGCSGRTAATSSSTAGTSWPCRRMR